ncbi:Hypothetical protein PHPALM_20140, partial [Phytophthora palmivora]
IANEEGFDAAFVVDSDLNLGIQKRLQPTRCKGLFLVFRFDPTIAERSGSFNESVGYSDAKEDDDEEYLEEKAAMPDLSEAAVVSVVRSGGVRSLARNLTEELDDVAGPEPATEDSDDGPDGLKLSVMTGKATSRSLGCRPPVNGDTPAANKVLGRCLELMKTRSNWMQLFGPKLIRQAVWMDLGGELAVPTTQRALDKWLRIRCYPSVLWVEEEIADVFRGVRDWGGPSTYSPTRTGSDRPIKAKASPYMQDSHMVTPRSASGSERLAEESESLRPTPNTRQETGRRPARNYDSPEDSSDSDSDSGDFDYLDGDLTEEWARQIRELSKAETKSFTPRLELVSNLLLGNIKPYFGLRNKSEKSTQWLRTFIYEMKGTHTPPNEWCMAFELSLQDGALHWYRQLPRKTRRTWKLLSDAFIKYYCSRFTQSAKARYYSAKREDKEHVCDYLNRLNGYARNAGVQFENGGRDAKDHVEHFLDTCDDRGLEERLCHVRVKVIDDLEDMVNDILRAPRVRETVIVVIDTTENVVVTIHARESRRVIMVMTAPRHLAKTNGAGTAADVPVRAPTAILVPTVNTVMLQPPTTANAGPLQRLTEPAIDADYMFAFAGEVNWPKDREITSVKTMENEKERGVYLTNVSVVSANYAKRLRLREVPDHGRSLEVRGINPGVLETRRRALVKITLGWERVYEFEMWIMNHSAGVDVVLGTDFMIPAGVRLALSHGTARLPDEVMVPLIKSLSAADDEHYGTQATFRVRVGTYAYAEQPPAVERREYPTPRNILTRDAEDSGPVEEAQVYCAEDMTQVTDTTSRECGRRDDSPAFRATANVSNGAAIERIPAEESERTILVPESGDRVLKQAQRLFSTHATDDALCTESSNGVASENVSASDQVLDEPDDRAVHTPCPTEDPECILNATYVSAMREIAAGVVSGRDAEENDVSEHLANDIELTDYAQELAFLPDLTEITVTALDYTGPNVQNKDLDVGQQQKLVDVLKRHEKIMISSGNALLPPAYGVVCDIDVQGHAPIKQRARRTPLRFLGKLYELLKRLLRAGLITFSDSPWASPIVIVLKKNGVDIRLCIDYKMVNAVTAIMEYVMPLVDDLLTDMEAYLCQHSEAQPRARTKFEADRESSTVMDAVSLLVNSPAGDMFANGEPNESSLVPVFDRRSFVDDICFGNETFDGCLATLDRLLQRFTECRISKIKAVTEVPFPTSKKGMQSFLGALNYYSRFIQDFVVYGAALYQLKDADFAPGGDLTVAKRSFAALQQKVVDAPILRYFDRDKEVHVMLFANAWALSSTLMQEHDGKLHPVQFCGRVLKDAEMNYHPAEKEILALLLLLKVCYTQLAGRTIHVYTRFSTLDWVHKSKTLFGRTTQFAVMLSPWHLVVERQLCMDTVEITRVDYSDRCERLPRGDHGEPRRVFGNNGVQAALEHTTKDLVIVGDSRLAIQQSLGVIACRKETLLTQLHRHRELTAKFRSVKYLHVVREFNAAADSLASETLENKLSKVVSTEARLSELTALNRIQDVIYEPTAKAETEDKSSVNTVRAYQAKVNEKRVRFANETSVVDRREAGSQAKANDVPTKAQNHVREEQPFYPVVHVSRLKAVNEFGSRPKSRLTPEVTEETSLDFNEELLPEDSWEPDQLAGEYEVEANLDDRVPLSTSTERAVREFKVKWLGYDEPTWEPASNLSWGGLLYDYLREKRSDRRLQMVQVADEN